jgi:NAD(P)-dependent dehydrogenase (short-subunit alcohol dehydrogenase family)
MALRQLARALDVARTVAWLASPAAAGHISGEIVAVAGGMEGRLLWGEDEVQRRAILARLERD